MDCWYDKETTRALKSDLLKYFVFGSSREGNISFMFCFFDHPKQTEISHYKFQQIYEIILCGFKL